jgi:hypothetical protein
MEQFVIAQTKPVSFFYTEGVRGKTMGCSLCFGKNGVEETIPFEKRINLARDYPLIYHGENLACHLQA